MVEPDKPQLKIRRKRFAYWINKTSDTQSEYVILMAVPQQKGFREQTPILLLHVHFLSCCVPSNGTRKYVLWKMHRILLGNQVVHIGTTVL